MPQLHSVYIGCGGQPASYLMGSGCSSPEREAGHSPIFGAVVKDKWNYTCTPTRAFVVCTGTALPLPLVHGDCELVND